MWHYFGIFCLAVGAVAAVMALSSTFHLIAAYSAGVETAGAHRCDVELE